MSESNKRNKKSLRHCGVPQCNNYQSAEVSMHLIPKKVLDSKLELAKWSVILRMGKKFPKFFVICSEHFKRGQILTAFPSGKKKLTNGAFPSLKLPVSSIPITKHLDSSRERRLYVRNAKTNHVVNDENIDDLDLLPLNEPQSTEEEFTSIGIQCVEITEEKAVQVCTNYEYDISLMWDTDKKLFTMTGIPTLKILDVMINMCRKIRPTENCVFSFRKRILLTMRKLKANCSFEELGILFLITPATAKRYFADIIQLLALGMKGLIHWQTREQNMKNLPKCFLSYPNVRTVLDCTEFKTVTSKCLECRTSTYSHYKGGHTLKVLIGVSPSGAVNYLSEVATGKSSDKAMFNLTNLLTKLEPGDAVMVDKGFLIADELANAGIEMIRPDFLFEKFSKSQVERSTKIASARVHVERRIARLKQMKVLSEKICSSVTPYIDEIMVVICALSNLSSPILTDDKF